MAERGTLLVVGAIHHPRPAVNVRSPGVQQAVDILGFERAVVANLFALPTYRSDGIADLGRAPDGWLEARGPLVSGLDGCDAVPLAYGTQEPSGEARAHHREQVRWLDAQIEERSLPT